MGQELGVAEEIINAVPTDGLWEDGRSDEEQLGMSYPELEQAMRYSQSADQPTDTREKQNLIKFLDIQAQAKHKIDPIPVCLLGE